MKTLLLLTVLLFETMEPSVLAGQAVTSGEQLGCFRSQDITGLPVTPDDSDSDAYKMPQACTYTPGRGGSRAPQAGSASGGGSTAPSSPTVTQEHSQEDRRQITDQKEAAVAAQNAQQAQTTARAPAAAAPHSAPVVHESSGHEPRAPIPGPMGSLLEQAKRSALAEEVATPADTSLDTRLRREFADENREEMARRLREAEARLRELEERGGADQTTVRDAGQYVRQARAALEDLSQGGITFAPAQPLLGNGGAWSSQAPGMFQQSAASEDASGDVSRQLAQLALMSPAKRAEALAALGPEANSLREMAARLFGDRFASSMDDESGAPRSGAAAEGFGSGQDDSQTLPCAAFLKNAMTNLSGPDGVASHDWAAIAQLLQFRTLPEGYSPERESHLRTLAEYFTIVDVYRPTGNLVPGDLVVLRDGGDRGRTLLITQYRPELGRIDAFEYGVNPQNARSPASTARVGIVPTRVDLRRSPAAGSPLRENIVGLRLRQADEGCRLPRAPRAAGTGR